MPTEPLPNDDPSASRRGSWLVLFITAFVLLTGLGIGLLIWPPLFIMIGVLFLVIGLQYVLWGYWMERYFRNHPREEESDR